MEWVAAEDNNKGDIDKTEDIIITIETRTIITTIKEEVVTTIREGITTKTTEETSNQWICNKI